jgi:uncharacterized protein YcbX
MSKILLSQIYIYPVKSARGIPLNKAVVSDRGLQYDRRWMLIDEENKFITARKYPRMILINTRIDKNILVLSAPGMPYLKVPLTGDGSRSLRVKVWKDECPAYYCGDEAENWFSQYLNIPTRLVHMPSESQRLVDPHYSDGRRIVSFADGFPFLLISEASLADLNRRLKKPLEMERFRPNLVIKGCQPYEEDSWKSIRIGDISFQVSKPCSRCVITTIDPSDGSTDKEPLRTLAIYRTTQGKVFFGQNLFHDKEGTVEVGMVLEVIGR